jgi:ribosome-associated protein
VRIKLTSSSPFGGARASEPLDEDEEDDEPAAKPARKTPARRR